MPVGPASSLHPIAVSQEQGNISAPRLLSLGVCFWRSLLSRGVPSLLRLARAQAQASGCTIRPCYLGRDLASQARLGNCLREFLFHSLCQYAICLHMSYTLSLWWKVQHIHPINKRMMNCFVSPIRGEMLKAQKQYVPLKIYLLCLQKRLSHIFVCSSAEMRGPVHSQGL